MHIEDLLFSFNGKIIAERNSNLASYGRAWYCRISARRGVEFHISRLELNGSCSVPQVVT